jgi:hypothetical protein
VNPFVNGDGSSRVHSISRILLPGDGSILPIKGKHHSACLLRSDGSVNSVAGQLHEDLSGQY